MLGGSERQKRQGVLSDHKRIGKHFIPPFIHMLPAIQDVKWVDRPLPELFWLALLNAKHGFKRGAELASAVAKAVVSVPDVKKTWFGPVSAYSLLGEKQHNEILTALTSEGYIDDLRHGLDGLVALYPSCPFSFLFNQAPPAGDEQDRIRHLKSVLEDLFDKTTKTATFMQANGIYIAFVTNLLVVSPNISLANFPAIAEYPHTEEAKRIASTVRASITAFFGMSNIPAWWPGYFWNRGLEIDDCMLGNEDHNE